MQSPLSFLGSHILALAFPVCLYSFLMFLVADKKKNPNLLESASRANIVSFFLISLSVALLISAFVIGDYSILYVYSYSNRSLPLFYKITGLWAGLDGSLLLWTWMMSLFSLLVFLKNYQKNPDWMPTINAVMQAILLFFLALMLFANNPFGSIGHLMEDGKGLNPLLQNIAMVVHPPTLYLGMTGLSVPFAFAIAALKTRRLDDSWIEDSRRWTIIGWFFLTLGLILGGAWAYVELGWGGFWAWDPVENAALMPWLLATAYLHSVMMQKRRGMLYLWNVTLIVLTFLFTIFGTYLTRSGVVQSVHAFSESNLGPYFLFFMAAIILTGTYFIVTRLKNLKSKNYLESYLSKESAFLFNNVVLLVATLAIVWGTMMPTISELITGQRITVGPPFFNQVMAPIGIVLLFLMGIGPMISWRSASIQNLKKNIGLPFLLGLIAALIFTFLGITQWYVVLSAMMIVFVFSTIVFEFYKGIRMLKIQKKMGFISTFMTLLIQSNRRFGAYIIHLGVLLIFVGIAGAVFKLERDFALNPGESFEFEGYQINYVKPKFEETSHYYQLAAVVDVLRHNKKITQLIPAKNFYKSQEQPSTEIALYQLPLEDLYLIIGNLNPQTNRADFRITLNPLISFIWLGGFVILLGVVIVLLPNTTKKWITTPVLIISLTGLISLTSPTNIFAETNHQHVETGEDPYLDFDPKDPFMADLKFLGEKILCTCGGCIRTSLHTCTCGSAKQERIHLMELLKSGTQKEEIIDYYIEQKGLQALVVPPEKGIFKLGYQMPAIILILGLGFAFFKISRWQKNKKEEISTPHQKLEDTFITQIEKEWRE